MALDVNLSLKRRVRLRFLVQNRSKIEICQLLQFAGFVAIFIEASYLIGAISNGGFYRGTCHVMLQHLAVYITLNGYKRTAIALFGVEHF